MLHLILILLSVLAAGVPMIGYLLLMRWLDRYEREPLTLVAAAFAWGAIGAPCPSSPSCSSPSSS